MKIETAEGVVGADGDEAGASGTGCVTRLEPGNEGGGVVGTEEEAAMELPEHRRSQIEFGNEDAPPIYVLYHANCADGFGAAYVCWRKFGAAATYIPVHYGQPVPEMPTPAHVYLVDFSYDAETLRELAVRHAQMKVVVIDHHKTAREELEKINDDGCDHRFFKTFDMDHSGAVLTWMHFFPDEPVLNMLLYVEDRDLWRWKMWESREFSAGLAIEPFEFSRWHEIAEDEGELFQVISDGRAALKLIAQTAQRKAAEARTQLVGVWHVPAVNCTAFISETCEAMKALFPHAPFVAAYFDNGKGKRIWSLRSGPDFDVSRVAKSMGGGGHPQAAGFEEAV